jgi:hypothetical protein
LANARISSMGIITIHLSVAQSIIVHDCLVG